MGRAAIALVLVAALPGRAAELDGGTPAEHWGDALYAECPNAPPPMQLADGSWNLAPARAARNACLMETCEARRRQLEPIAAGRPMLSSGSLVADLVLWALGIGVGLVLGWQLRGLFPR